MTVTPSWQEPADPPNHFSLLAWGLLLCHPPWAEDSGERIWFPLWHPSAYCQPQRDLPGGSSTVGVACSKAGNGINKSRQPLCLQRNTAESNETSETASNCSLCPWEPRSLLMQLWCSQRQGMLLLTLVGEWRPLVTTGRLLPPPVNST